MFVKRSCPYYYGPDHNLSITSDECAQTETADSITPPTMDNTATSDHTSSTDLLDMMPRYRRKTASVAYIDAISGTRR